MNQVSQLSNRRTGSWVERKTRFSCKPNGSEHANGIFTVTFTRLTNHPQRAFFHVIHTAVIIKHGFRSRIVVHGIYAEVAALRIFEREVGVAVLTRDLTAGACLTHGAAVQAIKDLRDANLLDVAIDGPGHVRRPIGTVAPLAGAVLAILRSRGNSSLERILGALAPRAVTAREVTEALDALREGGLAERSGSFWMATKVAQVPALPVEERVALALRGVLVHLPPSRAGKREAAALALLTKLEADGRFDTTDGMGGDARRELVGVRGRAMGVALDDLLAARLVERHGFTVKPGGTTHFRVRRPSVQR